MHYTYDIHNSISRIETTTDFFDIKLKDISNGNYINVFDNTLKDSDGKFKLIKTLRTTEDLEAWGEMVNLDPFIERSKLWTRPSKEDNVYSYIFRDTDHKNLHSVKDWTEIEDRDVTYGNYVLILNKEGGIVRSLNSKDDLEDWAITQERKIWTSVNPSHYKKYIGELQWIDAMCVLPTMKDPKVFAGALELQIRKYLDRRGQKDDDVQELKKAQFYLEYMIQYLEGRKPTAEAIHKKLQ